MRIEEQDTSLLPDQNHRSVWVRHALVFKVLLAVLALTTIIFLALYVQASKDSSNSGDEVGLVKCQVNGTENLTPSNTMHKPLRAQLLNRLNLLTTTTPTDVLFFEGGVTQYQYYSDTELYFRQESNFLYVTGYQKAGAVAMMFLNQTGGYCVLFVPRPTTQSAVWNGIPETIEQLMAQYNVDAIHYTDEFSAVAGERTITKVFTLPDVTFNGTDQWDAVFESVNQDSNILNTALTNSRAIKSDEEITYLRKAAELSGTAHMDVMRFASKSAFTHEFQVSSRFQEVTAACGGWSHQSYLPIVGAGVRSAVLHYNTNYEPIQPSDMVLVDAGAEFFAYGADITRTWPVSGKFTKDQAAIYNVVLNASESALQYYVPNLSFSNASVAANMAILQGLLDLGLVVGDITTLYQNGIHRIFMPHGLGHFLGLDVHDPGIYPQYLVPSSPLLPGMLLTVEPGIYFIPQLLADAYANPLQAPYLNQTVITKYSSEPGVGGYRIEDVVLITATGYEMLSSFVPRTVSDVEQLMNE